MSHETRLRNKLQLRNHRVIRQITKKIFVRLLGGKKKESKGLFGRKPVPAPNQQQGHSNVVNGNDLNRRLEDQFYRAKGYHNQNFRGFHQ